MIGLMISPYLALAQTSSDQTTDPCVITDYTKAIKVEVAIPGVTQEYGGFMGPIGPDQITAPAGHYIKNFGCYLVGIYRYFVSVAGILSTVFIMYGGVRYIISRGNPSAIQGAKDTISSALVGLLLALGSFSILYFINPNLTSFDSITVETIPSFAQQSTWCKDTDETIEGQSRVCGSFGMIAGTNTQCVWSGGCASNKICTYTASGSNNGYNCETPQVACEEYGQLQGEQGCTIVDEAIAAQGIKNVACSYKSTTTVSGTGSTTAPASIDFEANCVYDDLLSCGGEPELSEWYTSSYLSKLSGDQNWARRNCEDFTTTNPNEGCWNSATNQPGVWTDTDISVGWGGIGLDFESAVCTNTQRVARETGFAICCVDTDDVDCRSTCHGDEFVLPNCIYTDEAGNTTNYTGIGDACSASRLSNGEKCCMEAALRVNF